MENINQNRDNNKPYIFISYSHRNAKEVTDVIRHLKKDGYKVWYDEGITPGSNWDEFIAEHLQGSCCVLAFITEAYISSGNCRDELYLARQMGKPISFVYLEDAELTSGMKLRYNRIFALYRREMTETEFYEKLYSSENIQSAGGR